MTKTADVDIFISGGGIAGLTAAAAFGGAGFSVLCADPAPPTAPGDAAGADMRTTALLQPARRFLDRIGLWTRLEAEATPLQVMRIVDAGGPTAEPRATHDFDAADISDLPFGWNVPNWLLRREIAAHLDTLSTVDVRPGTGTADVLTRETEVRIRLDDGARARARLAVGADGRSSFVRQAAGIGARTIRYGQKALAFAVTHPVPHHNVSTEIHRSGGPFTLVPLPDRDGQPASAVVWMDRGPEVMRLAALDDTAFNAEMSERSAHLLGPLSLAGRRGVWPVVSQVADRMEAERVVLVAEAAHVTPPIGAQGLNMSLADVRVLLDLAETRRADPGARDLTRRYHRARHPEVMARVAAVDALNRASMAGARGLRDARMHALDALHSAAPVRRVLMRAGLGTTG